jgi:hypothetical protein
MATYYEIEIVDSSEHEVIKRLGELGFTVTATAPYAHPYTEHVMCNVIMQRERSLPEHGKLRDNYYASIATDAPPPMHFAAPPIRGGE